MRRFGDKDDDIHAQAFNHEGIVLSLINHPDVIRRIDHGVGSLGEFRADAILLDHIEAKTMFAMIQNEKTHISPVLPLADKLELFKRIVQLIAYLLWNNSILHCDLKTENILVSQDGKGFKLIDFGTAQRGSNKSPYVVSHLLQKRFYWAPELHENDTCHSEKTEVFSLGCVLFSLLFHFQPFSMATPTDRFYQHFYNVESEKYWAKVEQQKGAINPAIKNLLSSMFSSEPSERLSLGDVISILSSINL